MKKLFLAVSLLFGMSAVSQAVFTPTIISTNVLQSGTTFFVSSGTVATLNVSSITTTAPDGVISFTSSVRFSSTTRGIIGTTSNDTAPTGIVGETVSSFITATNAPSSGAYGDLGSISLTAGDWDVMAIADVNTNLTAATGEMDVGVSSTTGNSAAGLTEGFTLSIASGTALFTSGSFPVASPVVRMPLNATTTVYFKMKAMYPGSIPKYQGTIRARRMR